MNTRLTLIFSTATCLLLCPLYLGAADVVPVAVEDHGRYVLKQIGIMREDRFLIDTQTGRIWRYEVDAKGSPAMVPVQFETLSGGADVMPEEARAESVKDMRSIAELPEQLRLMYINAISGKPLTEGVDTGREKASPLEILDRAIGAPKPARP